MKHVEFVHESYRTLVSFAEHVLFGYLKTLIASRNDVALGVDGEFPRKLLVKDWRDFQVGDEIDCEVRDSGSYIFSWLGKLVARFDRSLLRG